MPQRIVINLPVIDLAGSAAFYQALGAVPLPDFSGDQAVMMRLAETIHLMLLTHPYFTALTGRPVPDAHESAQMLLGLAAGSRGHVDAVVAQATGAGGRPDPAPPQDHPFLYTRSFEDPDGHLFEVTWMDLPAATAAMREMPA